MLGTRRWARIISGLAVMGVLAVVVAPASAGPPSGSGPGNAPNAKSCQKNGYTKLVRSDGTGFNSEMECTSYAAGGGTLLPKPTELTPLEACQQAYTAATGSDAPSTSDANYILGTAGDDNFAGQLTAGTDVICGFAGDDSIYYVEGQNLSPGDVFLGGDGSDYAEEIEGGTFYGGGGDDGVFSVAQGTFYGGDGSDRASLVSSGTFYGGAGDDSVNEVYIGAFYGESGCDRPPGDLSGTVDLGDQSTCPPA